MARRFPRLPIPHRFLLIATAFVHLLPTAFVSLTDPCLPYFWNKGYPAMAGLIAMTSVFLVVTIEMFFAMRGAGHMHGHEWDIPPQDDGEVAHPLRSGRPIVQTDRNNGRRKQQKPNGNVHPHQRSRSQEGLVQSQSQPASHNYPDADENESNSDSNTDLDILDPMAAEESIPLSHHHYHHHHHHHHLSDTTEPNNPQKLLLQCLLLEAGILFHSIFIGMSLSISTGTPFVVLLIAISFHQTFEGLALGSRIAALLATGLFPANSPRPWLMALAYGATTPLGQAVGLWMHELYDPASAAGLLSVGITNAISSGLLVFAGLVELLAEDFLSEGSYRVLRGRRRVEAALAVAAGGVLMAVVGAFA
jgi:zinc transporter ZupT